MLWKHKNKIIALMSLQLCGLCIIIVSSFLYSYRINLTYKTQGIEKVLFNILIEIPCNISTIVRLYNIGIAIVLLAGFVLASSFVKLKRWHFIAAALNVLYCIYINDYTTNYAMFLRVYSSPTSEFNFYAGVLLLMGSIIQIAMLIFPISVLGWVFIKTKIYQIKSNAILYMLYFFVINFCVFIVFIYPCIVNPHNFSIELYKFQIPIINVQKLGFLKYLVPLILTAMFLYISVYRPFENFELLRPKRLENSIIEFKIDNLYNMKMVFHKYKNIFLLIKKFSQRAELKFEENPQEALNMLRLIEQATDDAIAGIVQISNVLNQDIDNKPSVIDIANCIDTAIEQTDVRDTVNVIRDYSADSRNIFCDKSMLTEVFVNIIRNAMEAMSDVQNKQLKINIFNENGFVVAEFTDNGCGITKEDMKKIFFPLYSTKSGGKNQGIGLYYVKRIVEMHSGNIYVKSKEGIYTTFQIVFHTYSDSKINYSEKDDLFEKKTIDL